MDFFWNNYLPNPVLLSVGPFTIRWYGLILVLGIIMAAWLSRRLLVQKKILKQDKAEDLIFYLIIFGLIGARLGHVLFFNLPYYVDNPANIVKVWHGGLSIQGALLAALITLLFWAKKHKISLGQITDCLVPGVALGQAIGRWGNYFNQELFGRPTDGWWGIPIHPLNRVGGYESWHHFHPAFFYESVLNLGLFYILYRLFKKRLKTGALTLVYFIGYGLVRFFMEFVRIDITPELLGLRLPQLISLGLIFVSLIFIYIIYGRPLPKSEK